MEEGKVQGNAATIKRSRAKKRKVTDEVLNSYSELVQQKDELSLLVETQQFQNSNLQQQLQNATQQYSQLHREATAVIANLKVELAQKTNKIAFLQQENESFRAQLGI